jgi:preprotein translocase subunit Sec61beta
MTYDETQNTNLDIDPAMVILGLGYATSLIVLIAWIASFVI